MIHTWVHSSMTEECGHGKKHKRKKNSGYPTCYLAFQLVSLVKIIGISNNFEHNDGQNSLSLSLSVPLIYLCDELNSIVQIIVKRFYEPKCAFSLLVVKSVRNMPVNVFRHTHTHIYKIMLFKNISSPFFFNWTLHKKNIQQQRQVIKGLFCFR